MTIKGARLKSVVFVDPGKRACAIAHWKGGEFRSAALVECGEGLERMTFGQAVARLLPDHLAIEIPQVYPHGAGKGEDPNDLIQVALSAGACMAACKSVETFFPGTWKGQVPKEIHHKRIAPELTEYMLRDIAAVPRLLQHNVLDAIALGLWWMKCHPT